MATLGKNADIPLGFVKLILSKKIKAEMLVNILLERFAFSLKASLVE